MTKDALVDEIVDIIDTHQKWYGHECHTDKRGAAKEIVEYLSKCLSELQAIENGG